MKKTSSIIVAVLGCLAISTSRAEDVEAIWLLPGSGDWNNPDNWSSGVVPRNSDQQRFHVTIGITNTAEWVQAVIHEDIEISQLTLLNNIHAGTGSTNFDVHIRDQFRWSGGSLTGWESRYHTHGEAIFDGNTLKALDRLSELFIHGRARWTAGHLHFSGYGHVRIQPGGELIAETTGYIGDPVATARADIHNHGLFAVRGAGIEVSVPSPLHNHGVVEVASGTVEFKENLDGLGSLNIDEGGRVVISRASTFSGNQIVNAGQLRLFGEHLVEAETWFNGDTVLSGVLTGSGDAVFSSGRSVSSEFHGEGRIVVPESGEFEISGDYSRLLRPVLNRGMMVLGPGAIVTLSQSSFTNSPDAVVELRTGAIWGNPHVNGGYIVNDGLFLKADGQGASEIHDDMLNRGIVRVEKGSMHVHGPVTNLAEFHIDPGGQLVFQDELVSSANSGWSGSGSLILHGTTEMRGAIDTNLTLRVSGPLDFPGDPSPVLGRLVLDSNPWDSLAHESSLDVVGELVWESGILSGPGPVRVLGAARIHLDPGLVAELKTQLNLQGETYWAGGQIRAVESASMILNPGVLWFHGNGGIELASGAFVNAGEIRTRENIRNMDIVLSPGHTRIFTEEMPIDVVQPPASGPFRMQGNIQLTTNSLILFDNSAAIVSRLAVTNSFLTIGNNASLHALNSADLDHVQIHLEGGTIGFPQPLESALTVISGFGTVQGAVHGSGLQVEATQVNGAIRIGGDLIFDEETRLTIMLDESDGSLQGAKIQVDGALHLEGELKLAGLSPEVLLRERGPLVLVESDEMITGELNNVQSGVWHDTPDGHFRYRIYYGAGSPYPARQVVLDGFGSPYDLWRIEEFDPAWLDDLERTGPAGDFNGDGTSNLVDFVFGSEISPNFDLESLSGKLLITVRKSSRAGVPVVNWLGTEDLSNWGELSPFRSYQSSDYILDVFQVSPVPQQFFLFPSFSWP